MPAGDWQADWQADWTETDERFVRRTAPAWALSLVAHTAILCAAALLFSPREPASLPGPPLRQVEIALAPPRSSPAVFNNANEAAEDSPAPVAAPPTSVPPRLPEASAPPVANLPELPGLPMEAAPAADFVIRSGQGTKTQPRVLPGYDDAAILAADAAEARPAGPSGPPARLSLFGSAAAEGRSFVFLIDRSKSMGGEGLGAIQAAAAELARHIDALSPEHQLQVIAYNQQTAWLHERKLLAATDEHKRELIQFVKNIVAYGATEHEIGLGAALRLRPDVVFVFTDGGDPLLNDAQLRAIRNQTGGRTAIHCLHFGFGPAQDANHFLRRLATQNRGSYAYVDLTP